jgi:hypothetical protein
LAPWLESWCAYESALGDIFSHIVDLARNMAAILFFCGRSQSRAHENSQKTRHGIAAASLIVR